MLKYTFAFIILVHGLIHLLGFAKAFGYGNITQLTKEISKPIGMLTDYQTKSVLISSSYSSLLIVYTRQ